MLAKHNISTESLIHSAIILAFVLALTGPVNAQQADADTYYEYGKQMIGQQKYQDALKYIEYALSLNPALPGAWTQAGYCYESLGQKAKAIEAYQKAVLANPEDAYAKSRIEALGGGPPAIPSIEPEDSSQPDTSSSSPEDETPMAEAKSKPVGGSESPPKKLHIMIGGGMEMGMLSEAFPEFWKSGLTFSGLGVYDLKPGFGLLFSIAYSTHPFKTAEFADSYSDAVTQEFFLPPDFFPAGFFTVSGGGLSILSVSGGIRKFVGGNSLVPYADGKIGFTSVSNADIQVISEIPVLDVTYPGDSQTGIGFGVSGGLIFGKKIGGFIELGFLYTGVTLETGSGEEAIGLLTFRGGISF